MSAVAGVIARLEAVSAVTALVSTRIYQGILPQKPTLPAIRVQQVSENELMHLRGTGAVYRTRVQIDSVSNAVDAAGVARSVDAAVHGDGASTGLIGWKGTAGGVEIAAVMPGTVRTDYDADELRQFKVMRDVLVWWKQ